MKKKKKKKPRAPSRKHRKRFELLMRNGARYLLLSILAEIPFRTLRSSSEESKNPAMHRETFRGSAVLASALESQFH